KGIQFRNHRVMGEIEELAMRYRDEGADELVFYDITASPEGRQVDIGWVARVSAVIDIPFCVAGGIRSVSQAAAVLEAGADKISVNTPALENPELITELARAFGSQCVVVGIDSLKRDGRCTVKQNTGNPDLMSDANRVTADWLLEAQDRGAGEFVLNCMNADGAREGYDVAQLSDLRPRCRVPLIASGGAGTPEHFAEVFHQADVDGALAATVFHSGAIPIPELKSYLAAQSVAVRP
ncbi:MAG: HisA/HisF-related TIM barrel protein, partial [Pseudomonadota bacterium]